MGVTTTEAHDTAPANGGLALLPDGLVVVVKRECETCQMIDAVLAQLAGAAALTVYSQDDPSFPPSVTSVHDADLAVSWHHDIETVPTLIRFEGGREVARTAGWSRAEWERVSAVSGLGADLPPFRPGCGSMSVDPDLVDALRVRFGATVLRSRRIELAELDDEIEVMFTRGYTDGLPVVPPTEERVLRMLEGTSRPPGEFVATVPPDLVDASVEKIAIAAVMAGCLPEYLPWVITAVEAICTDEFNIHGVLATTMPVGPVIVCSGPGTGAIGMNAGVNALGQGNRANMTIGRAVQLVVRNFGGGRPGEVDRASLGNPGKIGFCFAELEHPALGTLAASRGAPAGVDALTVFAGEGPRCIVDQLSRTPQSLVGTIAAALRGVHHHKLVFVFDALLIVSPEHARVFADAGWDRARIIDELTAALQIPGTELVRGAGGIAEGIPEHLAGHTLPKFRPGGLMLAHAGGGAGLFSAVIGGWSSGAAGSEPVTREVRR